jgi:hypothetical protein
MGIHMTLASVEEALLEYAKKHTDAVDVNFTTRIIKDHPGEGEWYDVEIGLFEEGDSSVGIPDGTDTYCYTLVQRFDDTESKMPVTFDATLKGVRKDKGIEPVDPDLADFAAGLGRVIGNKMHNLMFYEGVNFDKIG